MNYKNYVATVQFDADAKIFHGEVVGTTDVITFQGSSVEELEIAFRDSIDDYLEFCKKEKKKPDRSFSGTLNLRMTSEKHRAVAIISNKNSNSINQWINDAINEKMRKESG